MVDGAVGQFERSLGTAVEQISAIGSPPDQIARARYGWTNGELALGPQIVVRVVSSDEHDTLVGVVVEVEVHQPDVLRHSHFGGQREEKRMRHPVHVVQNHDVVRAGDHHVPALGVGQF